MSRFLTLFLPSPALRYRAGSPRSLALLQEIEMLAKGALEIVLDPGPGFYSHLFLVEKAMGGWRPVISLSPLNGFVRQTPFKMETAASVLLSVREGGFPSFRGFEGHIFSNTRSSVLAKAIVFHVGGDSLPVQGPVLRTVDCPQGLYPSVCSCVSVGSLTGFDFYGIWMTGWSLPSRRQWPGNTSGSCCHFVTLWGL